MKTPCESFPSLRGAIDVGGTPPGYLIGAGQRTARGDLRPDLRAGVQRRHEPRPGEYSMSAAPSEAVQTAARRTRRNENAMVPIVVIGDSINALGVMRGLARERMPIYLVCPTWRCAAAWSRHCRVVRAANLTAESILQAITTISVQSGQRPVVLLGRDEDVIGISERRDDFASVCRVTLPSPETVSTLSDKALFQDFAEREGFPVPRSVIFKGAADLEALRGLTMPVVIKPNDKLLVLAGVVERAVRVNTFEQAAEVATRMIAHARALVIQEWIDGADTDIFFCLFTCDSNSRVRGAFVGRKIVCYPPAVGSTAVCIAAPEAEQELISITTRLIDRVKYRGLGSVEFKRCRKTGRFLIVEPTVGRTDWQEEIATLCGVNIPLIAYRAELDLTHAEPNDRHQSIAWRYSAGFRIPRGILPHGTRIYDAFFRWSDPLPALYHYTFESFLGRVIGRTKRILGAIVG
jgi:D-aspartate ligase